MSELSMRLVTRINWRASLELSVLPEQQRFVSGYEPVAAIALAKAYVRPQGLVWEPYVFYTGKEMVGFVELAYEPDSVDNYWIFHFFIDHRYQGLGVGRRALRLLLQFVRDHHSHCQALQLTVHPENEPAQRLYRGAGFQPTGEQSDGEPIYRLTLSST